MLHIYIYDISRLRVKAAKDECYGSKDKIPIQESLVEVNLQALMDKTASRIIMVKKMP